MRDIIVVRPGSGFWLRWAAKRHQKRNAPYWLVVVLTVILIPFMVAFTELLPAGGWWSGNVMGVMIGLVTLLVAYLTGLLVMRRADASIREALANDKAARVHERIQELWHDELERIHLGDSKKPAWVWLTTRHYEALATMADRYRRSTTRQDRALAITRITRDMQTLGAEFDAYCQLPKGANPTTI